MQGRLKRIFIGLIVLLLLVEVLLFVVERPIGSIERQHRAALSALSEQKVRVERYERSTYLAVIGLATADWELLLAERRNATELAEQFARVDDALLPGASVEIDGEQIQLHIARDPGVSIQLGRVSELWRQIVSSHIRVLRSNHYELSNNPEISRFRQFVAELLQLLERVVAKLRGDHQTRIRQLARTRSIVPVVFLSLTLFLAALIYRTLIVPLGRAMEERQRSEQQLAAARDQLEQRVKERTAELSRLHQKMIDIAHSAGKAEVATNILHNVGNVLNGVNVLSQVIHERLQGRRWQGLSNAAALLQEQQENLFGFLTEDEKGRQLPEYLVQLAARLDRERRQILERNERLLNQIQHIKRIIQLQQVHAKSVSFIERLSVEDLIEDALNINAAGLDRHGATVVREYQPVPEVHTHKSQLLQILVNLISNAKYALAEVPHSERRLTIRLSAATGDRIRIEVADNGCGIAPEQLTAIFQHGYSTRPEGHGFGLHASVLAAGRLGGSLVATSDGAGKGACFTLELPVQAPSSQAQLPLA